MTKAPKIINLGMERVEVDSLKPHPDNPRRGDVETIRQSIRKNGFYGAIVARPDGTILVGAHRWLAAKLEGLAELDVMRVKVDAKTARRIVLADNRTSDLATYDVEALIALLRDVGELEGTGYDEAALEALIAGSPNMAGPARDLEPDELPQLPAREPVSRPGDVWHVGPHRIAVGDAREPSTWEALFAGAPDPQADMAFTSPPYNVGVAYDEHNDTTVPWAELREMLEPAVKMTVANLAPGRAMCWNIGVSPKSHPHRQALLLEEAGLAYLRQFVWRKVGVSVPLWHFTDDARRARHLTPNYAHEVVLVFAAGDEVTPPAPIDLERVLRILAPRPDGWAPTEAHEIVIVMANGKELELGKAVAFYDTLRDDVFTVHQAEATRDLPKSSGPRTGTQGNLTRRSRKAHPAPFPVALPEAFIAHLADVGAIVVDPFVGVGSTALAAHRLGRIGYGIELSPAYVDVALARLQVHTGQLPTLEGEAHDFSELLTP